MTDLMKCLYDFVCTRRMGSIYGDPAYREASLHVDQQTKNLVENLSQEQKRELNRLLDSVNALSSIEIEHLFQATLGLARELGG